MTTTVIVGFLVCYYNITGGCLLPNKLDLIDLHNDSKDVDILLEFRNFQQASVHYIQYRQSLM